MDIEIKAGGQMVSKTSKGLAYIGTASKADSVSDAILFCECNGLAYRVTDTTKQSVLGLQSDFEIRGEEVFTRDGEMIVEPSYTLN